MSVYVIACITLNPDEPAAYKDYLGVTQPLIEEAGARITQSFPVGDVVVGDKPAESVMIVEYPDIEAVYGLFESDAYKSIIPIRDRAFKTYNVSIIS